MNTPVHLIFAATLFAKPEKRQSSWAALCGGFAPDLSLYLMAGYSLFILGNDGRTVFGEQYYSDAWQRVFAVDNSVFVWIAIILLGAMLARSWLMIFGASGLAHIAMDFPLHNDDARAHFWPLSDWVFYSPLSYWDSAHYGHIVGPLEMLLLIICVVILVLRFGKSMWTLVFVTIAACQIFPPIVFGIIFR